MYLELSCPRCQVYFVALADTPAPAILDRMIEEGPWFALGNGATFREMIETALRVRGQIGCPDCRRNVTITGNVAQECGDLVPCHG
jgi:hypothetical protein